LALKEPFFFALLIIADIRSRQETAFNNPPEAADLNTVF
jgi:hypothetical protein